jgi:hypothetical protein
LTVAETSIYVDVAEMFAQLDDYLSEAIRPASAARELG